MKGRWYLYLSVFALLSMQAMSTEDDVGRYDSLRELNRAEALWRQRGSLNYSYVLREGGGLLSDEWKVRVHRGVCKAIHKPYYQDQVWKAVSCKGLDMPELFERIRRGLESGSGYGLFDHKDGHILKAGANYQDLEDGNWEISVTRFLRREN